MLPHPNFEFQQQQKNITLIEYTIHGMADPKRLFVAYLIFLALFAGKMWSMRFENRLLTPEAAVSAVLGTPAALARQMAGFIYRK